MDEKDKLPAVRVGSYGGAYGSHALPRVILENLTKDEMDQIQHAFSARCSFVGVNDEGRLEIVDKHKPLPAPADDPPMQGFWCPKPPPKTIEFPQPPFPPKHFEFSEVHQYSSPSITIQHLCAYSYTPERYKAEARKLESYGFACLRSRRGTDGKYWEIWYLSGLWSARGALGECLDEHLACSGCQSTKIERPFGWGLNDRSPIEEGDEIRCWQCCSGVQRAVKVPKVDRSSKEALERAVEFLRYHCTFGSLDICCQRLAMVID